MRAALLLVAASLGCARPPYPSLSPVVGLERVDARPRRPDARQICRDAHPHLPRAGETRLRIEVVDELNDGLAPTLLALSLDGECAYRWSEGDVTRPAPDRIELVARVASGYHEVRVLARYRSRVRRGAGRGLARFTLRAHHDLTVEPGGSTLRVYAYDRGPTLPARDRPALRFELGSGGDRLSLY